MKKLKWIFILTIIIPLFLLLYSSNAEENRKREIKIVRLDSLLHAGYPKRIAEQYVEVSKFRYDKTSTLYCPKAFFIADTRQNLIYCFNKAGDFVAKSPMIDGFSPQTTDPEIVKKSNLKWSELAGKLGFKYIQNKYVDTTNSGRIYNHRLVYQYIQNNQLAFFPKGAYLINRVYTDNSFHGGKNNVYGVLHQNREIANAIHGLYKSKYREENLKTLVKSVKTDDRNPKVDEQFHKLINHDFRNKAFNNSYGCLNVPESFIILTSSLAPGSKLIVLGEDKKDYLVKN
jgi:hypothetical protein